MRGFGGVRAESEPELGLEGAEPVAEPRQRAAHVRLHTLLRDTECARDLQIGELVLPAEENHGTAALGQCFHRTADGLGQFRGVECGIGIRRGDPLPGSGSRGDLLRATLCSTIRSCRR